MKAQAPRRRSGVPLHPHQTHHIESYYFQLSYGHKYVVVNFSSAISGVGVRSSIHLSYEHNTVVKE